MHVRMLNMARRLRPTSFSEIKGQEVSLSMLKNSLYSNTFFPTYLFTGQRGCGKTTTGRIFAAALNCELLSEFQKNPQIGLPCQSCTSCQMMKEGKHPDFVEVDAASHTGVDDVRAMLEAASYVPLQGKMKIYLIDEAHMLSKAAFNALLKMLEEPPKTALFMLATTEFNKVPATVRSRCFQIHFNALAYETLMTFLKDISQQEGISLTTDAANSIITIAEGCVRDGLNILEQISFVTKEITEEVVLQAMGMLPKEYFFSVVQPAFEKKPEKVLEFFEKKPLALANVSHFLHLLIHFFRGLIRIHYKVSFSSNIFAVNQKKLHELYEHVTIEDIHAMMRSLWEVESVLQSASQKEVVLEHLMIKIATRNFSALSTDSSYLMHDGAVKKDIDPAVSSHAAAPRKIASNQPVQKNYGSKIQSGYLTNQKPAVVAQVQSQKKSKWKQFIEALSSRNRMLASIFQQAIPDELSVEPVLTILFSMKSAFFKEKIADLKDQWHPIFIIHFKGFTDLVISETIIDQLKSDSVVQPYVSSSIEKTAGHQLRPTEKKVFFKPDEWPQAANLIKEFPGTVEITDIVEKK
ncbi:DNA polymerase III subunit gamma/tau [Candidatus Babeliales bacterium]|nr:DNA polymerase III subunit gamma/tau [Candidatus Babeliales bacterium]